MARYSSRPFRRNTRRWIYLITALLIFGVVTLIYRSPGKNKGEVVDTLTGTNIEKSTTPAAAEPSTEPVAVLAEHESSLATEPNAQTADLIAQAMQCLKAKPARIIEARDRLNDILQTLPMTKQQRQYIKQQMSKLADEWLFKRRIYPDDRFCTVYRVRSGDQLRSIGKKYKVPYEILMELNAISRPEALRANEPIKVINGPFHARVYRSTFTMDLYLQDMFVRTFPVGLGKPDSETPTGLWIVKLGGRSIKPTWTDPDTGKRYQANAPDYPLGSRWIGLKGLKGDALGRTGFAFHGTKDPDWIGTADSRGCIRLHNGDAILMYNILMPGYSQVEVVD